MSGIFEDSLASFLAPVRVYLEDESVSEILINGPEEIFVERAGRLEKTDAKFLNEQALQAAVRNIAQFVGRRVDAENPRLDARLPNGSRIHAVLPPASRKGTALSIRKFNKGTFNFSDLIKRGSITKDAARFLDICVFLAKNVIVSGGTGSGKTSFLNVLGARVPGNQRLLIIEDASELRIKTEHTVSFETRPPNEVGKGEVTIRDLVKSALRLRPDRIIVGEVRGDEALDLIIAMNTGHGGSMGTVHANSPVDALVRLETLAMMGDSKIPTVALRRQISSAIHIVVQIARLHDGTRKITHISEVAPDTDDRGRYQTHDLFVFVQRGRGEKGAVVGELIPTGNLPSFMTEIEVNQIPFGRDRFQAPAWYTEIQKKKAA